MRRVVMEPRSDWIARVEEVGFTYHSFGRTPAEEDGMYWFEGAAYAFTAAEIDRIEVATNELHRLCLAAVDYAATRPEEMHRFGLAPEWMSYVTKSWARQDPHLMGRFDLACDAACESVKLLEYNADTPTLAIETSLVQWFWKEDRLPRADQFNSFHEKLLERFGAIKRRLPRCDRSGSHRAGAVLHFAAFDGEPEELQHSRYFQDVAGQAGITVRFVPIPQIGWDSAAQRFVDGDGKPIRFLHKLYPWEWAIKDQFGPHLLRDQVGIIEPAWKMLLSNKALLPLLWRLFPGHPNLLPASWDRADIRGDTIAKPILAREGANMELVRAGRETVRTGGSYGDGPVVYQEVAPLPVFDGQHVVVGSWVIGDEAAGIVVREGEGPIVVNTSRVVPHWFEPDPGGGAA